MSDTAEIAVVSFDSFIHGNDEDRRAVAKQLYNAFSTVGWVYLKDHGIPQGRVDEIFDLVRHSELRGRTVLTGSRPKLSSISPYMTSLDGAFKTQS